MDRNCRLQARSVDGRLLGFSSELEFDGLVDYLESTGNRKRLQFELSQKYNITLINNHNDKIHEKSKLKIADADVAGAEAAVTPEETDVSTADHVPTTTPEA